MSNGKKFYLLLNVSFLFLFCFYLSTHLLPSSSRLLSQSLKRIFDDTKSNCRGLEDYKDYKTKCQFLRSQDQCRSQGYIEYLQLFYCTFGQWPLLGFTLLFIWLLLLFYLLANTASDYFCPALESLSRILKLSPTLAGVTLLSLGNGAPDVFSSIASFMGSGIGNVGLNSVLGGAFFVSSVVVSIVSISVSSDNITIDRCSFIRDVIFLLLALSSLLLVLIVGEITIWGAICFFSLYFIYIFAVCAAHFFKKSDLSFVSSVPLLPVVGSCFSHQSEEFNALRRSLLGGNEEEQPMLVEKRASDLDDHGANLCCFTFDSAWYKLGLKLLYLLELPLSLPRRLTIPVVFVERWSKPFGVASATLAPMFLSALWNSTRGHLGSEQGFITYIVGGLTGALLGIFAFLTTEKQNPPSKFLSAWLLGGFLMSMVWTYIIAGELVSLLVSTGNIVGINPSILGLTVLAWGNSIGDLVSNVALALNDGANGSQIAMSGCYAGPIFNILVGLGLGLLFSSWSQYPTPFVIPRDPSLFQTLGFLVAGLCWALVILPSKDMKLGKLLGVGLLAIYLCFLSLRLSQALGILQF